MLTNFSEKNESAFAQKNLHTELCAHELINFEISSSAFINIDFVSIVV